jgi:hypothetical protein
MRRLILILAVLLGIVSGFAATFGVMRYGISFDQQVKQGWEFVARAGAPEIDPYRRARLLSSGELPLASGEGFSLRAHRDAEGAVLDGHCQYRLAGRLPAARFWTLTLSLPDGRLADHATGRHGFTSAEIIRTGAKPLDIVIGPDPLPGNWLPAPRDNAFVLTLRFYETPLSATATILDAATMPLLERVRCTT